MTVFLAFGLWVILTSPLAAHTDFDRSDPAEGAVVTEPIDSLTIAFTKTVTLIDAGFEVLLPEGQIVEPTVTSNDDGTVWELSLTEPIGPGDVAVRYNVAADDGHPLSGGFAFVVQYAEPTTTTSSPSTSSSTTTSSTATTAPSSTSPSSTTTAVTGNAAPFSEGGEAEAGKPNGNRTFGLLIAGGLAVLGGAVSFGFFRRRT